MEPQVWQVPATSNSLVVAGSCHPCTNFWSVSFDPPLSWRVSSSCIWDFGWWPTLHKDVHRSAFPTWPRLGDFLSPAGWWVASCHPLASTSHPVPLSASLARLTSCGLYQNTYVPNHVWSGAPLIPLDGFPESLEFQIELSDRWLNTPLYDRCGSRPGGDQVESPGIGFHGAEV